MTNPDRSPQNPNLLVWHGRPWLIDHGAALYIHHTWRDPDEHARRPFERIRDHVLLPYAGSIDGRRRAPRRRGSTRRCSSDLVAALPDEWLPDDPVVGDAAAQRARVRPLPQPRGSRRRGPSSRRRIVPEPPRNAFQYAIVRVLPRVERGECAQRRGRAAVPADGATSGRGSRSTSGAWRLSRPTSTRRRSGRTSTRSSGSPPATRRPGRSPGSARPSGSTGSCRPSSTIIQPSDGPHRAVRRPGGRARPPRRHARRVRRARRRPASRPRRRSPSSVAGARPRRAASSSVPLRARVATSIGRSTPSARPSGVALKRARAARRAARAARPPVSGSSSRNAEASRCGPHDRSRAPRRGSTSPTRGRCASTAGSGGCPHSSMSRTDAGRP